MSLKQLYNNKLAFTAMSSSVKPKPGRYGSDIHRLLLAAEAGQKADILAYSSGHLGPRSLNQSQPQEETKSVFWRMSQSQEESRNPLSLQQIQTKAKKNEMKEFPPELTSGTALVEPSLGVHTRSYITSWKKRTYKSISDSLPSLKDFACPAESLFSEKN